MSNEIAILVNSSRELFLERSIDNGPELEAKFAAEAGFAIQALSGDYSKKIALSNRQSVIDAVTNVSAIGISLNPAKRQAYLVPRDGKICLDISYMGLIDLAVATGSILWAQCVVVYERDDFELQGYDKPPIHKYSPFATNRGPKVGAYACVKTPSGDFLTHTMTISEVYSIRDRSQSWKSGRSSPWKTDENEMIKKTVIKQAYKYWPKTSPQLDQAIHYLNTDGGEGLPEIKRTAGIDAAESVRDHAPLMDMDDLHDLIERLEIIAENEGIDAYATAWASLTKKERQSVGAQEHERLKSVANSIKGEFNE